MKKKTHKILAVVLTIALLIGVLPQIVFASDQTDRSLGLSLPLGASGKVITSFEELEEDIRIQRVMVGTQEKDLTLPANLAMVVEGKEETLAVSWQSSPAYNPDTLGLYVFEPQIPSGYQLAEGLLAPRITVFVGSNPFAYAKGTGTQEAPILIENEAQLRGFADLVNEGKLEETVFGTGSTDKVHLKLTADLTLTGEWVPIGHGGNDPYANNNKNFFGQFDGAGHTIAGLTINNTTYYATGLFGVVDDGTVSNLGIVNCDVRGGTCTGGLVGIAYSSSTIQNCYATGAVSGAHQVGGLVGYAEDSTIQNSYATGTVHGSNYVGGLVGWTWDSTIIQNSYTTGAVSGSNVVGGLVGTAGGSAIQNCYTTGAVRGTNFVGGLVGDAVNTIQNCYATGAVSGSNVVGGLVGIAFSSSTIQNSSALNPKVSGTNNVGRVVGDNNGATLTNNTAFGGMVAEEGGAPIVAANNPNDKNGASITKAQVSADGTLGGRFDLPAWVTVNGKLPTLAGLAGQNGTMPLHLFDGTGYGFAGGDGTVGDPYQIATETELRNLAMLVNDGDAAYNAAHYELVNNLTLTGEWVPIGHGGINVGWVPNGNYFKGNFNGGEHTIAGLYINNTTYYSTGLFGKVDGGTVSNIGIVNCDVTGSNRTGGLVGRVLNNSTIQNSYTTGAVSGADHVGGLVGYAKHSTIQNSHATGAVRGGNFVGGLAGDADGSTIENSYATGAVRGGNYVGGLIGGAFPASIIQNCYATGVVRGDDKAIGGLVGWAQGGPTIENSYAAGSVSGNDGVGGLVGDGTGANIQNCTALNPKVSGTVNVGRIVGWDGGGTPATNNTAFGGMVAEEGGTPIVTANDPNDQNGASITKTAINADGTLGVRFTAPAWLAEDGKLPTLAGTLGQDGTIPLHLSLNYAFAGGDGTVGNPYHIATEAELRNLATLVNDGTAPYADTGTHYELVNDLTLTGEWVPIGHGGINVGGIPNGNYFKGNFDGGEHTIAGLTITNTTYYTTGLFGMVDGGTVSNLGIVNCDVRGNYYTGGMVGRADNGGTIQNSYATGTVSGTDDVGGLVGGAGNITIKNSYATGAVRGTNNVGGLAGFAKHSTIQTCYATGAVSGTGNAIGGLVGWANDSTIQNSYATGAVSGTGNAIGGLVGWAENSSTIQNSYAAGSVSGNDGVGGLVGDGSGANIQNCTALNPKVSGTVNVGRIVGWGGTTFTNNTAFGGMVVEVNNVVTPITDGALDNKNGADCTQINVIATSFWQGTMLFNTTIWTLEQGKLPVLENLAGQNGEPPFHLTGFPNSALVVSPSASTLVSNGTDTVSFTITGMENWTHQTIDWTATGGTITPSATNGQAVLSVAANYSGTITVTAKNENSQKTVNATVTVVPPPTVSSVVITPNTVSVQKGDSEIFRATVNGTNNPSQAVTWSVSGGGAGTAIDTNGVLTVSTTETAATLTVTATSVEDTSKYGTATVTVTTIPVPVPTVSDVVVTPNTVSIQKGTTQIFRATVNGTNGPSQAVTWSVTGGGAGTAIDTNGVLTVSTTETAATLTVTATSVEDTSKYGTATVTVTTIPVPVPTVSDVVVTPNTVSIQKGTTQIFRATVNGTNGPSQAVTWSVTGGGAGTAIDTNGVLTVAATETATLTVTATSAVDSTKIGTATVTVTAIPPAVTITSVVVTPNAVSVQKGTDYTFAATVNGTNSPSQAVTWSVTGGGTGTSINPNGKLTVASTEAATLTVTATSVEDTSKYGTVTVTVTTIPVPVPTVSDVVVTPNTVTILKGDSYTFSAVVSGTNNPSQAVSWTVSNCVSTTTIDSAGLLSVCPTETGTTVTVTATSAVDSTKAASVSIVVTDVPVPPIPPTPPVVVPSRERSSGGTTKVDTAPMVRPFTKAEGIRLFNTALAAKEEGATTLTIKARGYTSADKAALQELALLAEKNGVTLTVHFDTVVNKKVTSRITVNPAVVQRRLDLTVTENKTLKTELGKAYSNPLSVVTVKQTYFGGKTSVVIKLPANIKPENIIIYSYNRTTKELTPITNTKPWVDKNGYLHFDTTVGGEIVISQGTPVKK